MPTPLESPITVPVAGGAASLTLTHEEYGFTYDPPIGVFSFRKFGWLDEGGVFVDASGWYPQERVNITGDDLAAVLAPNENGKAAGVFRTDDIRAKHQEIRAR